MRTTSVEFCSVLALRKSEETRSGRAQEECLPAKLEPASRHRFDKSGQRVYPIGALIPLFETLGNNRTSRRPLGTAIINEATHYQDSNGSIRTRGTYFVNDVFSDKDPETRNECYTQLVEGQ